MRLAIVAAWRKGENEISETIDSAKMSAPKGSEIILVEDTDRQGPGRTRHRGIKAAKNADVICIIDPHMRFKNDVLARCAEYAYAEGKLVCPRCWHNDKCSWDAPGCYHGADIRYKINDPKMNPSRYALMMKWGQKQSIGAVACVGGACYFFRRDWYMKDGGQPLNILPGWGGDEEILSLAAHYTGIGVEVFDGDVAHRYRDGAPWKLTREEVQGIAASRIAVIQAAVHDAAERADLLAWIRQIDTPETEQVKKTRRALQRAVHDWAWIKKNVLTMPLVAQPKRAYTERKTTVMHGVVCPHCHAEHDPVELKVTHTYQFSRAHKCPVCGRNFISFRKNARR